MVRASMDIDVTTGGVNLAVTVETRFHPLSQSIRVSIQSRSGYFAANWASYISPVGLLPTNTASHGSPLPILARIVCQPRGVQPESLSSPDPFLAVETG